MKDYAFTARGAAVFESLVLNPFVHTASGILVIKMLFAVIIITILPLVSSV